MVKTSGYRVKVGSNLAGGVDEGGDSSGHRINGVVDLVQSSSVYACYIFGVKSFKSIEEFNGDDFGFVALVLRDTCTNTSRLSSTMLG
jgi:hypothetical protein